jgi:hypothetical protein
MRTGQLYCKSCKSRSSARETFFGWLIISNTLFNIHQEDLFKGELNLLNSGSLFFVCKAKSYNKRNNVLGS